MSVILWKKEGGTWRSAKFVPENVNIALMAKSGWFRKPVDPEPEKQPEPIKEQSETVEEAEELNENLNPIREKARELGIEGWEKKRIKTLEKEIEELENDTEN